MTEFEALYRTSGTNGEPADVVVSLHAPGSHAFSAYERGEVPGSPFAVVTVSVTANELEAYRAGHPLKVHGDRCKKVTKREWPHEFKTVRQVKKAEKQRLKREGQ